MGSLGSVPGRAHQIAVLVGLMGRQLNDDGGAGKQMQWLWIEYLLIAEIQQNSLPFANGGQILLLVVLMLGGLIKFNILLQSGLLIEHGDTCITL